MKMDTLFNKDAAISEWWSKIVAGLNLLESE